jgi:O-antigen ligase
MPKNYLIVIVVLVLSLFIFQMLFTKSDKNKVFIHFILFFFPFLSIDLIPSFGSFTIFEFLTIFFFLLFYKSKEEKVTNSTFFVVVFCLLTFIIIMGSLNASSLSQDTWVALFQYFSIFGFAKILIDECVENTMFCKSIINTLKFASIFSLLFLLCQFVFGVEFSFEKSLNSNVLVLDVIRYPSYFQDPQKYAQFLAATSFLFLIKDKNSKQLPVINYIFVFLSFLALLFTGGRAGLGGWCIGLFIFILFSNNHIKVFSIITILSIFILVYNYADSFAMFKRSSVEDAYDFRLSIWQDAIKIFFNHPFLGIGIGNYANYVSVHNPDQFWVSDNRISYFSHPESGYLKFLTEFGLIGFMLVISLLLLPIIKGLINFRNSKDINIILIISALSSWMVGFYTVYSFDDARIRVLVITLICLLMTNYQKVVLKEI